MNGRERLLQLTVASELDVFALRRYAKTAAAAAGLESQDQVRLATSLSELGRDLLRAGDPMWAIFTLELGEPAQLSVELAWTDGRVPGRESILAVSRLLPQVGLRPEADRIVLECALPRTVDGGGELAARVRAALRPGMGVSLTEDLRAQTSDLMAALEESRKQHEELQRLNTELEETNQGVLALYTELSQELEETNRGVVALYADLDEKSRLLQEASESKTRFWFNVSHELRTPVNSVVGLTRLLLDPGSDPLTDDQQRQVGLVGAAGHLLLALVDELLDVAKAEAGRLEPHPGPVDLRGMLAQLRGILLAAPQPGVALRFPDTDRALFDTTPVLVTDEVMLARILRNLLSNSLKFTGRGEVRLDVARESPDSDWMLFTVTDTGVGIPQDQQGKVFEEFYQVAGPHQRNHSGTGLGLPYARRLAELLGGTLVLDSRPGEGTAVVLRLPMRGPAPLPRPPQLHALQPAARLGTVLCADDDGGFRESFRPVLERLAERVVEVDEGHLVVDAIRRERPDAVLLDLSMPGADGFAVLDRLAAEPQLRDIPVVVVTSADPATVPRHRLSHARAVLGKRTLTLHQLQDLLAVETGKRSSHEHP
ncbi:ATP-binding response regulator [Streptacidiphilus albus]|uniref:ATP-binding response regulator n=1 Tax=Streptacidiphilus albus TaxID=105425 RepID=UPI001E3BDA27|nr:ATP-binding protein [Streptacidiphilus albus]